MSLLMDLNLFGSTELFKSEPLFGRKDEDNLYNPWNHRTVLSEAGYNDTTSSSLTSSNSSDSTMSTLSLFMSPQTASMDRMVSQLVDEPRSDTQKSLFNVNAKPFEVKNDFQSFKSSRYFDVAVERLAHSRMNQEMNYPKTATWSSNYDDHLDNQIHHQSSRFAGSVNGISEPLYNRSVQTRNQFNYAGGDFHAGQGSAFQNATRSCIMKPMENTVKQNFPPMMTGPKTSNYNYFERNIQENQSLMMPSSLRKPLRHTMVQEPISAPARFIRGSNANKEASHTNGNGIENLIERCNGQLRLMEQDRKRYESDLMLLHPGKKISSANNVPLPRLPNNAIRLDKLVVDMSREHAKVFTLFGKMEQQLCENELDAEYQQSVHTWLTAIRNVQYKRSDEILSKTAPNDGPYSEEMSNGMLLAIRQLCLTTRAARTALWAAFITIIYEANCSANPEQLSPNKPLGEEGREASEEALRAPVLFVTQLFQRMGLTRPVSPFSSPAAI
ncbi:hypothetical protein HDE_08869 [Halotydeus destructor]|nr:hypothetical protein HDE_08869 [Halotydeus destructor]